MFTKTKRRIKKRTAIALAFVLAVATAFPSVVLFALHSKASDPDGTIVINGVDSYTLTVNEVYQKADGSLDHTDTDTTTLPAGEVVTLTATVPTGYTAVGDTTATVTMDQNRTVTFTYRLNGTTPTDPSGGTIPITAEEYALTLNEVYLNADGTTERTDTNTTTLPAGETVTLTADVPTGYTAVGDTTATVTMTENKTVTFTYKKNGTTPTPPGGGGTIPITAEEYTLTLTEVYQTASGSVERTTNNTTTIPAGETITLTATAPAGYTVVGATTATVTMNSNQTVTFTYRATNGGGTGGGTIPIGAEEYVLTLTEVYQNANGSVERTTNNRTTIPAGERITLTATPPAGYTVIGATTATVTMDQNRTVTFTYRKEGTTPTPPGPTPPAPVERFTIIFEDGLGNVILSQVVDKGAATPQPADPTREGYTFTGWTPSIAPTVTGAVTYTATWRENEKPKYNITVVEILVDEDGNVIGTTTRTIQYTEGETATIIAQTPEGYTIVGDSTVSFVVDGDKAVEFTYQKDATPDPIDPNPPVPADPDPVNPDPVNPDPVNPKPPTPVNPDPNPNPGGNGGGTIIPIPITPDDGNGGNGGTTPTNPDNGDRNKPDNGDPIKPDNGDRNKPDPTKPDNGDKTKPDNGDPTKPDDPTNPDDGDKPKPINPDPIKPDNGDGDKPGDGDKIIPDDGGKTPNWLTDDTPEARAIRRNVAVGVISGGVVVTLAATGALKYLWLLLLLLLFRHKKIVFHGILEKDSKSKYVQVKSTGAEKEAIPLQNYIDLRHTANDIYEAALASGYETSLPIGTTMIFEYADRLEKMKADETKMYEVLSEAKGKVGVNLVNKAAKIDIRLDFNLD